MLISARQGARAAAPDWCVLAGCWLLAAGRFAMCWYIHDGTCPQYPSSWYPCSSHSSGSGASAKGGGGTSSSSSSSHRSRRISMADSNVGFGGADCAAGGAASATAGAGS
eukprot:scaffold1356_cov107-Isochrysis_galbana.AAC.3